MQLISLNDVVPQMKDAPHKIYMLEFDHSQGELFIFTQNPLGFIQQFEEFADANERTTLNIIGIEGDKQGRDHRRIKRTHAIVADLRPLGIYFLYWAKADTVEGMKKALQSPLLERLSGLAR